MAHQAGLPQITAQNILAPVEVYKFLGRLLLGHSRAARADSPRGRPSPSRTRNFLHHFVEFGVRGSGFLGDFEGVAVERGAKP
jgi:hypothetical protein